MTQGKLGHGRHPGERGEKGGKEATHNPGVEDQPQQEEKLIAAANRKRSGQAGLPFDDDLTVNSEEDGQGDIKIIHRLRSSGNVTVRDNIPIKSYPSQTREKSRVLPIGTIRSMPHGRCVSINFFRTECSIP